MNKESQCWGMISHLPFITAPVQFAIIHADPLPTLPTDDNIRAPRERLQPVVSTMKQVYHLFLLAPIIHHNKNKYGIRIRDVRLYFLNK